MITKSEINLLQNWAKTTSFPLRRETITSKYMKYDPSVCYVKFGKNNKIYKDKLINQRIKNIIKNDNIFGVAYISYPPKLEAKPHRDFNLWGRDFRRIQIPLKIPKGRKCYIEWIDNNERTYWEEGKPEIFDVQKLHRGANNSDEKMIFLYLDIDPNLKVEK